MSISSAPRQPTYGFNTRQTDVRPAQSINTAFQLVAVIFQLQSLQQFGGVSATHIDWTMVPYVRKSFRKHWNDGLKYMAFWPVTEESFETEDRPIDEYCAEDDYKDIYRYATAFIFSAAIESSRYGIEAVMFLTRIFVSFINPVI